MRRSLSGYRRADLVAFLDAYQKRLEAVRRERSERLRAADEAIAAATEAVSAVETKVAGELERIRGLLGDLTMWSARVHQRVTDAKARYEAEEARDWAALTAVEGQVAARRAIAERLSLEVLAVVGRTQAALSGPALPAAAEDAGAARPEAPPRVPVPSADGPAGLPEPSPLVECAPEPVPAGRDPVVLWLADAGQAER